MDVIHSPKGTPDPLVSTAAAPAFGIRSGTTPRT